MANIDSTYKILHGCHDCNYVFIKYEYDDCPAYYCHFDQSTRPICGSVAMEESFFTKETYATGKSFEEINNAWEAWSDAHSIQPWGICSLWKEKVKNERA